MLKLDTLRLFTEMVHLLQDVISILRNIHSCGCASQSARATPVVTVASSRRVKAPHTSVDGSNVDGTIETRRLGIPEPAARSAKAIVRNMTDKLAEGDGMMPDAEDHDIL